MDSGSRILHGERVDLVHPFPDEELDRVYQWLHAFSSFTEHDDSPANAERYKFWFQMQWSIVSYALRLPGEGESIGLLYFEPNGARDGYLHIALSRRAWGKGIADDAAAVCIADTFHRLPELTRLSASMLERNRPAQALARRMGFEQEAIFRDMVVHSGVPGNAVHFGLTRRDWERHQLSA